MSLDDSQIDQLFSGDSTVTSAAQMLENLSKGDVKVDKVIKFVREGFKLDNSSMVILLAELRKSEGYDYKELLKIYLTLDKAVEEGVFTNEFIEELKKNKDKIISNE